MNTKFAYPLKAEEFDMMHGDYEMYRLGAQFSGDIFFKIDMVNQTVRFLGNKLSYFKNRQVVHNYMELVRETKLVFEDDVELFEAAMSKLHRGIEEPVQFRMNTGDGQYIWYAAQYAVVRDDDGAPRYAIGKMNDIQERQDLADKANLDLLTACLNKGTFEAYAAALMQNPLEKSEGEHVFLIIDIDNFKAVNDNLGHFFGDIVLKDISTRLTRIFRATDYIGRIGGDEFGVIMKNVVDSAGVIKKVKEVLAAVDATYQGKTASYRISGSVGIAAYPRHGNHYTEIYQNADAALYHSKFTGKNKYTIYDQSLTRGTMVNTTPFDMANRALSHFFDQEVAMDVFNLLFEETGKETSVNQVLRHLGKYFRVDRCYIFEFTPDSVETYDNTYEWCEKGVEPQIDFLQQVDASVFGELFADANHEGVYYCNDLESLEDRNTYDILAAQGIKSFLHTYVKRNGVVNYVLGYDDCTSARIWTPSEISTLMYASKIIAQFLAYQRALVSISKKSMESHQVLDALNFYAYIVDAQTYTVKYFNEKTRELAPFVEIGQKSQRVMKTCAVTGEKDPLAIFEQNPQANKLSMGTFHKVRNVWVLITASKLISYDGRESIFISVMDVGNQGTDFLVID